MKEEAVSGWYFTDERGSFALPDAHKNSYLYFPLVSEKGMVSAITPTLHGDIKTGQNTFLTPPVSVGDLHSSRAARNFWVNVTGYGAWSATGNSAPQIARNFADEGAEQVDLAAGFLWHKVTRTNASMGLQAQITNFVPPDADQVELMRVTLTNLGEQPLTLTATGAIPMYGRSADNLRDHRHVTSLLQRIRTHGHGVLVRPTLSFDERGHKPNTVTYAVLGAEADGMAPGALLPIVEEFIGEGGTLDWPEAVVAPKGRDYQAGQTIDGYEAMGGLRFQKIALRPGESHTYVLILAILEDEVDPQLLVERYGSQAQFETWLARTEAYWEQKLRSFQVHSADTRLDGWMKWVALQPILRRICGNSFLPYHDYGRGGRGWRDLWQDLLASLIMESTQVRSLLLGNFAGVRMDGSNATIIGSAPGEFKADRNNIPRVWMDHGVWPLLTTQFYIDHSGDLAFLLEEQVYFKDPWINRAQAIDELWQAKDGTHLKTVTGEVYQGTVLEHLLIQHLTAFFNVGEHNCIKLEGADWNDGMDMAKERGESVAFTAFYASNLRLLSQLVLELDGLGVTEITLASELMALLDTLTMPVDYNSVAAKQTCLAQYYAVTQRTVSGDKTTVTLQALADDLAAKASWLYAHLRGQEWIEDKEGFGWFNGYYDNDGKRVEGEHADGVRMTLTGQVFAMMGDVATDEQAREMIRAADRYLFDPAVGGYRLNTDFGEVLLNLGRCFGFAFGHKENGAMFSHMAVMYANALYRRGFVREGYRVLEGIYRHSQNFATSRMYPGIPEYVSAKGRGMYSYLTGSASWYLFTTVTEVFGVRGVRGDLALNPKLVPAQFDEAGTAGIHTLFAGRRLEVVYHNPGFLEHDEYQIEGIKINGEPISIEWQADVATLPRDMVTGLEEGRINRMDVTLVRK
jgi:cellobiose phosphorylase